MTAFTTRPELAGTFGAVASTHWIASAVGMKILEAGGNAFDAAAAAGFVLQVVEPHLNGPAGDAPILVARHDDIEPTVICGQGPAPAAASIDAFKTLDLDLIPGTGSLAPCVPGAFGAWLTMLRDWGTVSLRAVLEPAITYAITGHPIHFNATGTIQSVQSLFVEHWTTSAAVFLKDGATPQAGSLFCNPALGETYAALLDHAERASSKREEQIDAALQYWYEGPIAESISRFVSNEKVYDVSGRHHTGFLTATDMGGWRPPIERPLSVDYRGFSIFKCGVWSQGPALLQALRILEGFDISALDDQGPEFVHVVTEALKLVMADRDAWYGDVAESPIVELLSREYASHRRELIGHTASLVLRPGSPAGIEAKMPHDQFLPARPSLRLGSGSGEPTFAKIPQTDAADLGNVRGDTCHVDVVDRWGNMVSATPSGGWLQSNPIIPDLGFALGTRMQMFWLHEGHPNSLAPGKRPRTTLTPSMAFKGGRPYLAFGTPGGDQQDQWSLQLLLRHIDKGMPLQRTIDSPGFHTDHLVSSFWPRDVQPGSLTLEGSFPQATVRALEAQGHKVEVGAPWSEGRLSACSRDIVGESAMLHAAANPRGMQGYAIAR